MTEREHIEEMLRAVFGALHGNGEPGFIEARDEFVFHMADWIDDLHQLAGLYGRRDVPADVAARAIVGFIFHVAPHLNAAGRLLLGHVPDPFAEKVDVPGGRAK